MTMNNYKSLWLENLKLLDFFESELAKKSKLSAVESSFDSVNYKLFQIVTYFLFGLLPNKGDDQERMTVNFSRSCWPIYDRVHEANYRKVCLSLLKDLIQHNRLAAALIEFTPGLLVTPVGPKMYKFLSGLTIFVMDQLCGDRGDNMAFIEYHSTKSTKVKPSAEQIVEKYDKLTNTISTEIDKTKSDFANQQEQCDSVKKKLLEYKRIYDENCHQLSNQCAQYAEKVALIFPELKHYSCEDKMEFVRRCESHFDTEWKKFEESDQKLKILTTKCSDINERLDHLPERSVKSKKRNMTKILQSWKNTLAEFRKIEPQSLLRLQKELEEKTEQLNEILFQTNTDRNVAEKVLGALKAKVDHLNFGTDSFYAAHRFNVESPLKFPSSISLSQNFASPSTMLAFSPSTSTQLCSSDDPSLLSFSSLDASMLDSSSISGSDLVKNRANQPPIQTERASDLDQSITANAGDAPANPEPWRISR